MSYCLHISKSKNAASFYVLEKFRNAQGKSTSRVFEKLGTLSALKEKLGLDSDADVQKWAEDYVAKLNAAAKSTDVKGTTSIEIAYNIKYPPNEARSFNVGYLSLQQILYRLGFSKMIHEIQTRHRFNYNLEQILAQLVYARILAPGSKRRTYAFNCDHFLETPEYELHQIYRALDVIEEESSFIQSFLYKRSGSLIERDKTVLYYDCTNFYFEISQDDNFRKRGLSKEHQPKPLVGLGLFMDAGGLPLAFDTFPGNTNEQVTLQPLEKKILKDFELSGARIIVCTDAGLASLSNRQFNTRMNREFIVTQPIKTMKTADQKWALSPGRSLKQNPLQRGENPAMVRAEIKADCWRCDAFPGKYFSLDEIDEEDPDNYDRIFYKEKYLVDPKSKFEQRLIVTYSIKYKRRMEAERNEAVERAKKIIKSRPHKRIDMLSGSNSVKYVKACHTTNEGTEADQVSYCLDEAMIEQEAQYDGFYAVCTSIDADQLPISKILQINKGRWEIEAAFRVMKTSIKSRPVYVYLEERIKAHFCTCFIALLVIRLFEKKLNEGREEREHITTDAVLDALREMQVTKINDKFFCGSYKRTEITDRIDELSKMPFCYEFISKGGLSRFIDYSKKFSMSSAAI